MTPIRIRDQTNPDTFRTVPCGKCVYCYKSRQNEWALRLDMEIKRSKTAKFLTLTYSEENIPAGRSLNMLDVQKFIKRLRKKNPEKIKYYYVGEYGNNTKRPHYHMILFNSLETDFKSVWNLGHVHEGSVTQGSIRYTLKYMNKELFDESYKEYDRLDIVRPFAHMSQGIGSNYVEERQQWHSKNLLNNFAVLPGGFRTRLPRYFREKLYSKAERGAQNKIFQDKKYDNYEYSNELENIRLLYQRMDRDINKVKRSKQKRKL